jgi:hypothetical protein
MESGLTQSPEQRDERRRQNLERTRQVFGGKFHDGSQLTVDEVLERESTRRGVSLVVKKEEK